MCFSFQYLRNKSEIECSKLTCETFFSTNLPTELKMAAITKKKITKKSFGNKASHN